MTKRKVVKLWGSTDKQPAELIILSGQLKSELFIKNINHIN